MASSSAGLPLLGHGYGPAIAAPAYGPALAPAYGNLDITNTRLFYYKKYLVGHGLLAAPAGIAHSSSIISHGPALAPAYAAPAYASHAIAAPSYLGKIKLNLLCHPIFNHLRV